MRLTSLQAETFLNEKKRYIKDPLCQIKVAAKEKRVIIFIHKKGRIGYIASASSSEYLFIIDSWIAEEFMFSSVDKFKKEDQ